MKNNLLCFIGLSFILGKVFIALNPNIKKENREYLQTLDNFQYRMYLKTVNERKNIYFQATFIGLVVGFIVLLICKNKSNFSKACAFVATVFIIQYFWYMLSPKKYVMLKYLNNKKQIEEWHDVYKAYQFSYHLGLFVGLVGYFLFGWGY